MLLLEMRCPWLSNREIKRPEKTSKYALLWYELRRRYPGYKTEQHNIIHYRGAGRELAKCQESLRHLVGSGRCNSVLRNMQKAVVSSSLTIIIIIIFIISNTQYLYLSKLVFYH